MTPRTRLPRIVFAGLLGLAVFSALFSLAVAKGWWPRLPPGALHDSDLWAGFAGGVGLLLLLLRRNLDKSA